MASRPRGLSLGTPKGVVPAAGRGHSGDVITCPVCENVQAQGVECDVCGRPFPASQVREAGHAPPEVEPVPGLEPTRVDTPPTAPAPLAADAPCVWCGHVQSAGRLCDRCGMQRHRGAGPGGGAAAAEAEGPSCPECGLLVTRGSVCPNCGIRLPEAE